MRRALVSALCVLVLLAVATAVYSLHRSHAGAVSTDVKTEPSEPHSVSRESPSTGTRTSVPAKPELRKFGRTFAWAPAIGASAYEVEIVRNGTTVFAARTKAAHVQVPHLLPGAYHWYVWPLVTFGSKVHRASAVVAASFVVGD